MRKENVTISIYSLALGWREQRGFARPASFPRDVVGNIEAALYPQQKPSGKTKVASGFTLVELLVVVLIIGILAAVALPQYNKAVFKSRMSNLQTVVRSMNPALLLYNIEHSAWPTSFKDLDILTDGSLRSNDTILLIDKHTACDLWRSKVACFYPGLQPYKVYITIENASNPPSWKCCWSGENNLIKSLCQQFFPSGEYVEKAPQHGFIGEQCIVTPY